jgi:hypothetical protein
MDKQTLDAYYEGIVKLANHNAVKSEIEPNILVHKDVSVDMVQRVLRAKDMLDGELWNSMKNTKSE